MNKEASKAIEQREDKAVDFLQRYHSSRTVNTDPFLQIANAVEELIQIVKWLRIDMLNTKCKCSNHTEKIKIPICECGHYMSIHVAGYGACSSHNGNDFDCNCMRFYLSERE